MNRLKFQFNDEEAASIFCGDVSDIIIVQMGSAVAVEYRNSVHNYVVSHMVKYKGYTVDLRTYDHEQLDNVGE